MSVNERTFQGELYRIINSILEKDKSIGFDKITQEENVGIKYSPKFADGKLYSSKDTRKIVLFELKNSSWDATDEDLVNDAGNKANINGYDYFVTGTPRQLALYKTFESGKSLSERKLKIYTISNIKKDDEVLLPNRFYEKIIKDSLTRFLKELSQIVHQEIEVHWDSIDVVYVNRLSAYILEASAEMLVPMTEKIESNPEFKTKLKQYLRNQEVFNVTLDFHTDDIYKICQLANYLLFIKIIFYSYLQRDVKELNLKPIEIPNDIILLNQTLKKRFNDVLQHDYEMVFTESVFDDFEYTSKYLPLLRQNIEEIKKLEFKDLNVDIMGAIYNTLIDNQEQHDRGQHFTNTNEVDIICAFCINKDTKLVLDSGCGAGTFLVRAYNLMRYYSPNLTHEKLLERLWGIDIAPFPVFLSTINLCLLSIKAKENYPMIINSDFLKIRLDKDYKFMFLNASKLHQFNMINSREANVKIPVFDCCIGNPPYIRQELIEHKEKWIELVQAEHGIKKINKQSDLYFYYLLHTSSFLKNGGRLGYVISSSWLDVTFGEILQKFLLDNFKIIAIIDHQTKRSFSTALINTVILIIEKCDNPESRNKHNVKFVRVTDEYASYLGKFDDFNRVSKVQKFIDRIDCCENDVIIDNIQIQVITQNDLFNQSYDGVKYKNGYWGAKYLRAPEIYYNIRKQSQSVFKRLSEFVNIQRGVTTGANNFFYLIDDTANALNLDNSEFLLIFGSPKTEAKKILSIYGWYYSLLIKKHLAIEREFLKPIFKTQEEARGLDVDLKKLNLCVLYCKDSKDKLTKSKCKVLDYINTAESKPYEINKRPSFNNQLFGRTNWYDITKYLIIGDFIFPAKIGERYRLIDNRETLVTCDKVNYAIKVKPEYKAYSNDIFLILNSICFRFFIDLFSRQMVVKVSDVDVNLVQKTYVLDPQVFHENAKNIKNIYESLKSREQESIFKEIDKEDKKAIDLIILKSIGLGDKELEELYKQAALYVQLRKEKSDSLKTKKTKKIMDYNTSLRYIDERFSDIPRYRNVLGGFNCEKLSIPSGKPIFQKESSYQPDLFSEYFVAFKDAKKTNNMLFKNQHQIELFRFLSLIGYDKKSIKLPINPDDCYKVLQIFNDAYSNNIQLIKSLLKSNRSKADAKSIFRDLIFS